MRSQVVAILASLAFLALLGTLFASLQALDLGMENKPRFGDGSELESGDLSPSDDTMRVILAIGSVVAAVVTVVSVAAMVMNMKWFVFEDLWKWLVALLIILCVIMFIQLIDVARESGAVELTGGGGPLGVRGTEEGGSPTEDALTAIAPLLLLLALGVALATAAFLAAKHVLAPKHAKRIPVPAEPAKRMRALDILNRGIDELTTGVDVRTAVINCYLRMEALAERRGGVGFDTMTPREFAVWAEAELGVSGETLEGIIALFEEARYSPHEMSEEKRGPAVASLRTFMEALDSQPPTEGQIMPGREASGASA